MTATVRIAFHAAWTMRHKVTLVPTIERALASGPVSSRELAQRICDVEAGVKERQSIRMTPPGAQNTFEDVFEVVERPLLDDDYWDCVYDEDWFRERKFR